MKSYKMKINGQNYDAKIVSYDGVTAQVNVNGVDFYVELQDSETVSTPKLVRAERTAPDVGQISSKQPVTGTSGNVVAPIPGLIIDIKAKLKDVIKAGDTVVILEAMKMESEIAAPIDGTIVQINNKVNDSVQEGDVMVVIQGMNEPKAKPVKINATPQPSVRPASTPQPVPQATGGTIVAPMPGTVLEIKVAIGDMVTG